MASKNMFEVLRRDESDEETQEKKPTKHQQRADDKQKRESTGDYVAKDNQYAANREGGNGKPVKTGYSGEGKRENDRQSGSGANAHNKYEKKSGGGKGNWGKEGEESDGRRGETGAEGVNDQPEEQGPPPMSLDDYFKEQGVKMETKVTGEERSGPKTTTADKGMHVLAKKGADWTEPNNKNKDLDALQMTKTTNIEGLQTDSQRRGYGDKPRPAGPNKGGKPKKLGGDDFPPLG